MKRIALVLFALAACTSDEPPPDGELVVSHVATVELAMFYGAATDVLFVVDNSPASAALQPQFRAVARTMLERMETYDYGKLPDVHVGVVTTDLADQGRLSQGRYLADALQFDQQRHRNYDGTFVENALALLDVGSAGSSTLRPIAAIQMALSPTVNPGFRRDNHDLVVVVLTAGDDADPRSLEELRAVLPPGSRLTTLTGCDASTPRLDALTTFERATLCDPDPARGIAAVGLFRQTLEARCLPGVLADADPSMPGTQHDCASWMSDPLTGDTRAFPECSADRTDDCWTPHAGFYLGCDAPLGLELRPRRLQYDARAHIECVVEPTL